MCYSKKKVIGRDGMDRLGTWNLALKFPRSQSNRASVVCFKVSNKENETSAKKQKGAYYGFARGVEENRYKYYKQSYFEYAKKIRSCDQSKGWAKRLLIFK